MRHIPIRRWLPGIALAPALVFGAAPAWSQQQDAGVSVDASATDDAMAPPAPSSTPPAPPPAPPAPSATDSEVIEPRPVLGDEARLDVAGEVQVVLRPPHSWGEGPGAEVDIPELAQVPGSEVVVKREWSHQHPRIRHLSSQMFVLCASAPASEWAPGMESLLFERLNGIANSELGKRMAVASFNAGQIEAAPPVFRQSFQANGKAGADRKEGSVRVLEVDRLDKARAPVNGTGRHVIGFLAEPERVLICSAACIEPIRHGRDACADSMASFRLEGPLAAEPSPSQAARLLLGIKRRPSALLGTALGLLLALVGVLVILRGLMIRPNSVA